MKHRTVKHFFLISCALAASACGSTSSTPFVSGSGSPDGAVGTSPTDGGGGTDAPGTSLPDAAGTVGDASISNGGDAAGDGDGGTFDFGCGNGAGCSLSQVCCTSVGPPISFNCADPATCPAADKIECDGPDECNTAAPVCCGVAVGNGSGTFPACNAASLGATCTTAASCPTFVGSCSQTSKLQICHVAADCTEPTNNKCCTFSGDGGAHLSFCYDPTTAALAGGSCH